MKKLIRKLILWSFDNKPTYNKSETVLSNGDIKMKMVQFKLDGYVTETQLNAVESELNLIKEELKTIKKENTTTKNSDAPITKITKLV